MKAKLFLTVGITLSLSAFAQTNRQTAMVVEPISPTPIFRVNVVSRSVRAVNYEHRSGPSKLDFAGTDFDALCERGSQAKAARLTRQQEACSKS